METAKIEKLIPGGQALATLDSGKKAFIWGALPGETVEFEITKQKSSFVEGIATKILSQSERRSNPRDPCFLSTSPWQIMSYDYELEQKSALVLESFRQNHIDIKPPKLAITDGRDYFYRNKMEYSLYWNNETSQIDLAFHARSTHRKAPITQSSIERPEIFSVAQSIVAGLNAEHKSARDYQSLLVRCNQQGTTSVALFENRKPHPQMTPLRDTILGHEYTYSPNGFFQINLPVYELALQEIGKHITTEKVLDLYAGVGTIGLSVARDRDLTLVEASASAYAELQNNCASVPHAPSSAPSARHSGLVPESMQFSPNINPVLAKSEDVLDFVAPDATIILDPPRAGCDSKLIEKLNQTQPPAIIYLSCNPITQARDIASLLPHYNISHLQPFNFFPRTPHIENLTILTRTYNLVQKTKK